MTTIENLAQLREETQRLKTRQAELGQKIKTNIGDIKESLKPENILINSVKRFTGFEFKKGGTFFDIAAHTASFVIRLLLTKAESNIENKVIGVVDMVIDRAAQFFKKFRDKFSEGGHSQEEKDNPVKESM